jgi:hypothetical protein
MATIRRIAHSDVMLRLSRACTGEVEALYRRLHSRRCICSCIMLSLADPSDAAQAYLILDEFILAGELQESSKQIILERIGQLEGQHLT